MRIILLLILLQGCSTPHTRIVYSEGGGMFGLFSGKSKSCTIYSQDQNLRVESLVLNADEDEGTCVGKVGDGIEKLMKAAAEIPLSGCG